jgi:hypothetical protein
MTRAMPPVAEVTAALQSCVEAFEQFGVQFAGGEVAEHRPNVHTHQVLVPVTRGVLELGDLQPAADGLAERDVRLGLAVLVDLALQPRQSDLRGTVGLQRLP